MQALDNPQCNAEVTTTTTQQQEMQIWHDVDSPSIKVHLRFVV